MHLQLTWSCGFELQDRKKCYVYLFRTEQERQVVNLCIATIFMTRVLLC